MATAQAFLDQALHYFTRPAVGRPTGPVESPAAWTGEELRAETRRWTTRLTDEQLDELEGSGRRLIADGVGLQEVTAERFPIPLLGERVAHWRDELRSGLGVVLVGSLPVRRWGQELSAYVYWGLGHHIGRPGAQNAAGELLGHVTDYGDSDPTRLVRSYRTAGDIAFHCDAADVVGLLCLRTAAEGGRSRIASSVSVFNRLLAESPELAAELFEPFAVDRRDEQDVGEAPTFDMPPCAWDGTSLRTFWHSDYMRSAQRHDGVELSDLRRRALDRYDAIAGEPEMHLDMWLGEGDIQLISNHTVIHARTAYVDDASDPDERRHLLRLWLSL